jgi:uncharacterized protein YggE
MVKRTACSLVIALSLAGGAAAWDKRAVAMPGNPGQTCALQETGQVGVSFNNVMVAKLDGIGREMDQRIDEVIAFAKQAQIEKIEVQSYNYNVYPASGGYPGSVGMSYQYNGSVSFSVEPCSRASDLMSLLASKGYAANLNVNAYRQCQ